MRRLTDKQHSRPLRRSISVKEKNSALLSLLSIDDRAVVVSIRFSGAHILCSLLESRFFLTVRKPTEKFEYRQKNIFLTVYAQKNTHRNINFSVGSPSETIFLWVSHAQKNCVRPD